MNIKKFIKLDTHDNFVTEKADVIQNKLLGDYNAKGKYVINKKIVNELVELKKVKLESYNNSIFVNAKTQSGRVIDFQIDFKKNSNSNLATGVLSTLEPVEKQGGRLTNIIKTPIAKYTNELVPDFIDRTLKTFNVVINDEGDAKEFKEDETQDAYLLKRNMLLKALDKLTVESYNVIYEDYFTQRINLLKKTNNAYTKKVLAIFNDEFSKVSEYFLVDKKSKKVTNYKAMNELLDKAFEDLTGLENYSEQEKQYREKILPVLGMFITSAERVEKTAQQQVLDTFPKKTRDALTDTLVDVKQTQESVIPPEIQEKNPKVIKDKMDKKLGSIANLAGIESPVSKQQEIPVQTQQTSLNSLVNAFTEMHSQTSNNSGAISNISDKVSVVTQTNGSEEIKVYESSDDSAKTQITDVFKARDAEETAKFKDLGGSSNDMKKVSDINKEFVSKFEELGSAPEQLNNGKLNNQEMRNVIQESDFGLGGVPTRSNGRERSQK